MLRSASSRSLLSRTLRRDVRLLSSTPSTSVAAAPNPPLDLDPSLKALIQDAEMAILRHKSHNTIPGVTPLEPPRELEVYPTDPLAETDYMSPEELELQEAFDPDSKQHRKSPAAKFGSLRTGQVVLPLELETTITKLIADVDKPLLYIDAKRLFLEQSSDNPQWDTAYDVRYKTAEARARHAERDGTAFASVALPAHYSAIYAVMDHLRERLGPDWSVGRIIDWGAGTGSGLWALSHAFQKTAGTERMDHQISASTLTSYVGIEKREGLSRIGKRLLKETNLGDVAISWQKGFHEENKTPRTEGKDVVALSAFMLSSLPNAQLRKQQVKQMWESGADVIVLIDHNTVSGFGCIAEARDLLLRMGRSEMDDPEWADAAIRGCHVVAPCPHDGDCPLFRGGPSRLVCGFSQRMQRANFVRKTKHVKAGHEDVGYSYVVIRRGQRPPRPDVEVGRLGGIGLREQQKLAQTEVPMAELSVYGEAVNSVTTAAPISDDSGLSPPDLVEEVQPSEEMKSMLRSEAYYWPRLVFPPLKRSGHVILDACTAEGKIMRMTIPKSQGKQPYYDARKSSWGDIFPHPPKNPPLERFVPETSDRPRKGEDIGKQSKKPLRTSKHSYTKVADDLKEKQRRIRQERRRQVKEELFEGTDD